MHADAFFAIGSSHPVCQDYARSGTACAGSGRGGRPPSPYAIVSDGCSSSPDSDFGSRLLAAAAVRCLRDKPEGFDPVRTIKAAARAAELLVGVRCLDATLFAAFLDAERRVHVRGYGDGVLIARYLDGRTAAWDVRFNGGAPAYLSYLLDDGRFARYLGEGYGERTVDAWCAGRPAGGSCRTAVGRDCGGRPAGFEWRMVFEPDTIDLVLLSTDGIHSFREAGSAATGAVPFWRVVENLVSVKTFAGAFLARRCRRFLTRFCVENGWRHYDDFGVAGIWLAD